MVVLSAVKKVFDLAGPKVAYWVALKADTKAYKKVGLMGTSTETTWAGMMVVKKAG